MPAAVCMIYLHVIVVVYFVTRRGFLTSFDQKKKKQRGAFSIFDENKKKIPDRSRSGSELKKLRFRLFIEIKTIFFRNFIFFYRVVFRVPDIGGD